MEGTTPIAAVPSDVDKESPPVDPSLMATDPAHAPEPVPELTREPNHIREIPPEAEDEDEWEYEYSATETETFYLPVDFSIPAFSQRRRPVPVTTRGGHQYRNWTGPTFEKRPEMKHHRLHSDEDDDEEDDDDNDAAAAVPAESDAEDEADATNADAATPADEGDQQPNNDNIFNDDQEEEPLQIQELHSENPLFLYRNRVFEGSWSRVIGTELLFTEQPPPNDPAASGDRSKDRLPSLRSLSGNVDLLAASWSRIMTTEKKLHKKKRGRSGDGTDEEGDAAADDPLRYVKRMHGIRIPVWSDKTGERTDQTRFLEDMMAIKKKRGERDEVTVYATTASVDRRISSGPPRRQRARDIGSSGGYRGEQLDLMTMEVGAAGDLGARGSPARRRGRARVRMGDSSRGDTPMARAPVDLLPGTTGRGSGRPRGRPRGSVARGPRLGNRPRAGDPGFAFSTYVSSEYEDEDDDDFDDSSSSEEGDLPRRSGDQASGSVPTPSRWSDLQRGEGHRDTSRGEEDVQMRDAP